MKSSNPHRIDPPNPVISEPASKRSRSAIGALQPTGSRAVDASESNQTIHECRQEWLELQAAELISQLQRLSMELDARESQLNVRASLQDNRERKFRLRQQDELLQLSEQQRALDRRQQEIETQVRQLAFREA